MTLEAAMMEMQATHRREMDGMIESLRQMRDELQNAAGQGRRQDQQGGGQATGQGRLGTSIEPYRASAELPTCPTPIWLTSTNGLKK